MRVMTDNNTEYQSLANNRSNTQIAYALLYIELTFCCCFTAVWTGIAVANRVGQAHSAVDRRGRATLPPAILTSPCLSAVRMVISVHYPKRSTIWSSS